MKKIKINENITLFALHDKPDFELNQIVVQYKKKSCCLTDRWTCIFRKISVSRMVWLFDKTENKSSYDLFCICEKYKKTARAEYLGNDDLFDIFDDAMDFWEKNK